VEGVARRVLGKGERSEGRRGLTSCMASKRPLVGGGRVDFVVGTTWDEEIPGEKAGVQVSGEVSEVGSEMIA